MFPPELFRATLNKAAQLFKNLSIPFHLTGGLTTIVYGEPRLTQDVDLVVGQAEIGAQLDVFLKSVEDSDFLSDPNSIRLAIQNGGLFQLMDQVEVLKLDIYSRELIPGELSRSIEVEVLDGLILPVASRTDAAASKLIWISKGSHKNRRDLRRIYLTCGAAERETLWESAASLKLDTLLADVLAESDAPME